LGKVYIAFFEFAAWTDSIFSEMSFTFIIGPAFIITTVEKSWLTNPLQPLAILEILTDYSTLDGYASTDSGTGYLRDLFYHNTAMQSNIMGTNLSPNLQTRIAGHFHSFHIDHF
jgi:hypothetical protein